MATAVAQKPGAPADDDEEWLYGDSGGNEENKEPAAPGTGPDGALPPPKEKEEGEMSGDEQPQQEKYEDDEDSDDDDDVQVTIGDIKAFPMNNAGGNLFKPSSTYQKQPVVAGVGQKISTTTPGVKGVDIDTEGMVNGVNVYEFSLDSLRDEEKPWRTPGADITDYFNYGFNEDTWRKYCQKQNRLRSDNGVPVPRAFASMGMGTSSHTGSSGNVVRVDTADVAPPGMNYGSSTPSHTFNTRTFSKPPPQQQTMGTIAVLGSTAASRRPADEHMDDVQHIGTVSGGDVKPSLPIPGMPSMGMPPPDYSMPPPGLPPMPPQFPSGVPPPGISMPPPLSMYNPPPAVPAYGYPTHIAPPPDRGGYGDRPPYSYDTTPTHPSYPDSPHTSWDPRNIDRERDSYRERERWDNYKIRERSPAGSGYSSEGSDDYNRYSRTREYSGRDYESREYYSRSRDVERTVERTVERSSRSDRDRSKSREREKKGKTRDRDRDEKKSKRKIKDEPDDADYYKSSSSSSKHKKSKRSKRDKEDESAKESEGT